MISGAPANTLLTQSERALTQEARAALDGVEHAEPAPGDHAAEDALSRALLARLAGAGLLEHLIPPEHRSRPGGTLSVRTVCVLREELARASGAADAAFVMQGLGSCALALAGSGPLKERWLRAVGRGEAIAAIAMTEPSAGSDLSAIATRARRDGGDYDHDGEKTYISNAGLADVYTDIARTSDDPRGVSAFLVEATRPGLTVTSRLTISAPHPIGSLSFAGCRIPASQRLGEEGDGLPLALRVLERFRPTVGAAANGMALRALEESIARAKQRRQFGRAIAEFQAIQFKLADMAVRLEAARLMVLRAASLVDDSTTAVSDAVRGRASAMAKLFATEAAQETIDEAVQIHGALGVTRGSIVERLYREVRALRIYEGTSEIQRAVIARGILAESPGS
jgi:alkylation response protein AidB-like acyl-CoA dehydrogenase